MRRLFGLVVVVATAIALPAVAATPTERSATGTHRMAAFAGERGCTAIADDDVVVVPHGFLIHRLKEFVPYDEALPSPDGRYWRCTIGGQRSRFMAPEGAE
jgi:hypothetical protein